MWEELFGEMSKEFQERVDTWVGGVFGKLTICVWKGELREKEGIEDLHPQPSRPSFSRTCLEDTLSFGSQASEPYPIDSKS